jgi:hypothetical protein
LIYITPLLRAGGECEKIILSPLPRYMKRCCRNKEHLTNKRDEDYASKMGEALADIRDSMKDLVYGKKIRSFKVLNTTRLIMGDDAEEAVDNLRTFWREDPVHMTQEGYNALLTMQRTRHGRERDLQAACNPQAGRGTQQGHQRYQEEAVGQ